MRHEGGEAVDFVQDAYHGMVVKEEVSHSVMTWLWKRSKPEEGYMERKRFLPLALSLSILCALPLLPCDVSAKEWKEKSVPEKHEAISKTVQKVADAVDSFFANDRLLSSEENKTTITLRLDTDFIEYHGVDFNPTLKLRLSMPRLKRVMFVVNEDADQSSEYTAAGSDDETSLALRWTGRSTKTRDLSFDAGLRIRDSDLGGFGRVNAAIEYRLGAAWIGRSTNRLYWYTDTGWRNDLRQYFERRLGENLLFRSRTRFQYFEEHGDRIFPEQKLTVYQKLKEQSGVLAYELVAWTVPAENSVFDDDEIVEPDDEYSRLLALLRYRRRVKWPWLFVEIWPGLGFAEERDYSSVLYGRLRVDIHYGHFFEGEETRIDE